MNPLNKALRLMRGEMKSGALLPRWSFNRPKWSEWDTDKAVKEGYKASTWVYACVRRRYQAVASVPWKVFTKPETAPADEWTPDEKHPLATLLDQPNPWMSGPEFFSRSLQHLDLGGNSLIHMLAVQREGRQVVVELWPISPVDIQVVPSREEFIKEYVLPSGTDPAKLPGKEVIHLMYPDPSDPFWGMSPLMAAARTVDTDTEAVRWNKIQLQNRAVPDGAFAFQYPLTDQQFKEARAQIREMSGPNSARIPWSLGGGAKWVQMSQTPVDLDWLEGRKMNRVEICAAYEVPPVLVGVFDDATLANAEVSRRIFWADTIVPILEGMRSSLNRVLIPKFGGTPDSLFIDFDTSAVEALQDDLKSRLEQAKLLYELGTPVSEINRRLELDLQEWPGWDQALVGVNKVPLEFITAGTLNDTGDEG